MQKKVLELMEIIWEITGACQNHCSYCGSKAGWNEEINVPRILQILGAISLYPPKEINISGGDPLLVDFETHKTIVDTLKPLGVRCKLIINPKSVNRLNLMDKLKIIDLYDVVGISVNDKDDCEGSLLDIAGMKRVKPFAIITNFNTTNLFSYDRIEALVKKYKCTWIVQYTIYKEEDSRALYLEANEDAWHFLKQKVSSSAQGGVKLLISDNASDSPCGAGRRSLGILSTGNVVGCLSMRSWMDLPVAQPKGTSGVSGYYDHCEGSLFGMTLKEIWENKFQSYRFQEFHCCKDQCLNKILYKDSIQEALEKLGEAAKPGTWNPSGIQPRMPWFQPTYPKTNDVYVYGAGLWEDKPWTPTKQDEIGKILYGASVFEDKRWTCNQTEDKTK